MEDLMLERHLIDVFQRPADRLPRDGGGCFGRKESFLKLCLFQYGNGLFLVCHRQSRIDPGLYQIREGKGDTKPPKDEQGH
ncbi:MAG: hypothetical protein P1U81_20295 [Verrucomicrobiales bacterium]|nr:hypothetical protein [Verrucomicrobiales bacterium]